MNKVAIASLLFAVVAVSVFLVEQKESVNAFDQWKKDFNLEFTAG